MIHQFNCRYSFRYILVPVLIVLFLHSFRTFSQQNTFIVADTSSQHKERASHNETGTEKFNPGNMIIEHVVDNHEWHIVTIGHVHLTIPLPVILLCQGKLYAFWSTKFHNSDHSYKGFTIAREGPDKGKIITIKQAMTGIKDAVIYDFSITKTVFAILISCVFLILIFVSVANRYTRKTNQAPSGLQNLLEPFILFIRDDIAKSSIGEKRY